MIKLIVFFDDDEDPEPGCGNGVCYIAGYQCPYAKKLPYWKENEHGVAGGFVCTKGYIRERFY